MSDSLSCEERDSLTVVGEAFSAQVRTYGDLPGNHLAFVIREDATRSTEDGHPAIIGPEDVAKLHALLEEAARR